MCNQISQLFTSSIPHVFGLFQCSEEDGDVDSSFGDDDDDDDSSFIDDEASGDGSVENNYVYHLSMRDDMSMHPSPCDGESAPSDSDIRSHISCRTDTHSEDEYIGTDDDFSSFECSVSTLTSHENVNDYSFLCYCL